MSHPAEPRDAHQSQGAADPTCGDPAAWREPQDQASTGWELIRCPGCRREHARRTNAVLVLSCSRCGRQPEAFALQVAERLELRPLGPVGAQVVGRDFAQARP
jgi:hypothetical protein